MDNLICPTPDTNVLDVTYPSTSATNNPTMFCQSLRREKPLFDHKGDLYNALLHQSGEYDVHPVSWFPISWDNHNLDFYQGFDMAPSLGFLPEDKHAREKAGDWGQAAIVEESPTTIVTDYGSEGDTSKFMIRGERYLCWDHGCNGREFSSKSNYMRHTRERTRASVKSSCPLCSAVFTRSTARDTHLAKQSCNRIRRYSNGRMRPSRQAILKTNPDLVLLPTDSSAVWDLMPPVADQQPLEGFDLGADKPPMFSEYLMPDEAE